MIKKQFKNNKMIVLVGLFQKQNKLTMKCLIQFLSKAVGAYGLKTDKNVLIITYENRGFLE